MDFLQLELLLFEQPTNLVKLQRFGLSGGKKHKPTARYYKTQEVLKLLKLEKPNAALCSARARNGAYRHDRYVAIHVAHDKWELFRRCSVRKASA